MTAVGTATAQTEMLLPDDSTTAVKSGKVRSRTESPHQGTLAKGRIPPSATAKITETETTTGTTAGTATEIDTTAETETDMTAGIGTDRTGITATVNTGRWTTTVPETTVWT